MIRNSSEFCQICQIITWKQKSPQRKTLLNKTVICTKRNVTLCTTKFKPGKIYLWSKISFVFVLLPIANSCNFLVWKFNVKVSSKETSAHLLRFKKYCSKCEVSDKWQNYGFPSLEKWDIIMGSIQIDRLTTLSLGIIFKSILKNKGNKWEKYHRLLEHKI